MQGAPRDVGDVVADERENQLRADNDRQGRQYHGAGGRWHAGVQAFSPVDPTIERAERQQRQAQGQLYRGEGHVAQVVAVEDAFDEIAQVLDQNSSTILVILRFTHFVAIFGTHRNVDHERPKGVEAKQQVGFEEIASAYPRERQMHRDVPVSRGEAVGGGEQVPVARRQLRHK